jgi:MFS family permease
MKHFWLNSVFPIAALFAFRMLGLFMLIPVFTVSAKNLEGANATLIGIALGAYGLSQGLLQMPFGILSDRVGRKPIITFGLILFAIGSLMGAFTHTIYGMIFARIVQGMGAIGSVLIALLADLTPDAQRTKSMAVIGSTIGISFSLAMVISPALTQHGGLSSLFYLTALLAVLGLLLLHLVIPDPKKEPFHLDSEARPKLIKSVLANRHLQRLNAGIFFQHLILTSTFYAIPLVLQQQMHEGHLAQPWHFYLPIMTLAFLIMVPFILLAEKKQKIKSVFLASVIITLISQSVLAYAFSNWLTLCSFMLIYFLAFNILEALLPSLVSKQANIHTKGTAMGVYSSSQFLGIFFGGCLAGILFQFGSLSYIFVMNAIFTTLWLLISLPLKPNAYQTTLIIEFTVANNQAPNAIENLKTLPGVQQVVISKEENLLYLLINKAHYRPGSAETAIKSYH